MEEPIERTSPMWVPRTKENIPKVLGNFIGVVKRGDREQQRLVLTAFRSYELCELEVAKDLSSVTNKTQGPNNYVKALQADFKHFLAVHPFPRMVKEEFQNSVAIERKERVLPFHYTVKKGISGSALGTAGLQAVSIAKRPELVQTLSEIIRYCYPSTGFDPDLDMVVAEDYSEIIHANSEIFRERDLKARPKDLGPNSKYLGRIAFIPDSGGKTRTVAIGNYWIQNALLPIHKICFRVLRKIAMDGTHDQLSQSSRVERATLIGPNWSFDLTKATDLMPLNIQVDVLKHLDFTIGHL